MKNSMNTIYTWANYVFDPLHYFWEKDTTQRAVAGLLVVVFLLSIGVIELKQLGLVPAVLAAHIPNNHFMAINVAFSLVLVMEVIGLIFTLPCSISKAVGKQFEILALILLRDAFKTLAEFPEPITISGHVPQLWHLIANGCGAVAIFALLGVYTWLRRYLDETLKGKSVLFNFVASKKLVALAILCLFAFMGIENGVRVYCYDLEPFHFFKSFYTVLIFSDILLVLIAQRFMPGFKAVFRNSGYALSTLLIRLALTAPPFFNVAIGVGAALFACVLTLVYNAFYSKGTGFSLRRKHL